MTTSNQSRYRAMMEEVRAPAELLGKVKGIPMEKTKKAPTLALRYATVAMAALIGTFAVSNGVCYAATGETWVEKAIVMVNGDPVEVTVKDTTEPVKVSVHADGATEGEVVYQSNSTATAGSGALGATGTFEVSDLGSAEAGGIQAIVLEGSDGRVHVSVAGGAPVDVTDQLAASGAAAGTCEADGVTYAFEVTGQKGAYRATAERA